MVEQSRPTSLPGVSWDSAVDRHSSVRRNQARTVHLVPSVEDAFETASRTLAEAVLSGPARQGSTPESSAPGWQSGTETGQVSAEPEGAREERVAGQEWPSPNAGS